MNICVCLLFILLFITTERVLQLVNIKLCFSHALCKIFDILSVYMKKMKGYLALVSHRNRMGDVENYNTFSVVTFYTSYTLYTSCASSLTSLA